MFWFCGVWNYKLTQECKKSSWLNPNPVLMLILATHANAEGSRDRREFKAVETRNFKVVRAFPKRNVIRQICCWCKSWDLHAGRNKVDKWLSFRELSMGIIVTCSWHVCQPSQAAGWFSSLLLSVSVAWGKAAAFSSLLLNSRFVLTCDLSLYRDLSRPPFRIGLFMDRRAAKSAADKFVRGCMGSICFA